MKLILQRAIAVLMLMLALAGSVAAGDMGPVNRLVYFLAADADGVQQVYQLLLDGQSEPRQITSGSGDVLSYGVAYDGLSIAYIRDGQLWLQPIHDSAAEALTPLGAAPYFGAPVYSVDGDYIAYADNGVWLFDLANRTTRQLLENVPINPDGSNMAEMRSFLPERFIRDATGKETKLLVDVGVWEWNTAGVVDLASGTLTLLEGQDHISLLPLYGERVLVYGNSALDGAFALHLAQNLDEINAYDEVLKFSDVTDATLYAEQAVEIHPGTVRVVGTSLGADPAIPTAFRLDVNLMEATHTAVTLFTLPTSQTGSTLLAALSPDGAILPVYQDALWSPTGGVNGRVLLFDVMTGKTLDVALPEMVGQFRWQP